MAREINKARAWQKEPSSYVDDFFHGVVAAVWMLSKTHKETGGHFAIMPREANLISDYIQMIYRSGMLSERELNSLERLLEDSQGEWNE